MSSDLGHISGGELAQIGQIAGGDVHLSAAVHRNLSAQAWRLSERGEVLTADTRAPAPDQRVSARHAAFTEKNRNPARTAARQTRF